MASSSSSKRKKSATVDYDPNIFMSHEAYVRYTNSVLKRPLLPERGIKMEYIADDYKNIANSRQWQQFCA